MRRRSEGPRINGPYEHGDKWRFQIVTRAAGGGRKAVYRSFATREQAEAWAVGARDQAQGVTVSVAVEAFLAAKALKGRPADTVLTYRHMLATIVGHVMQRPVRYLLGRGAELYEHAQVYPRGHRRAGQPRAAASHHNALERARDFCRFCVKQRWLRVNPFADVEKAGQRVHGADKARLTVDESRRLDAWCRARGGNKYAVLTLAYLLLGTRASELCKRNVRDLDDGGRLLWIGKTKTAAGRRRLAIPAELAELLRGITAGAKPDAPIFTDYHDRRLTRQMARHRVMEVCHAAGVSVVPPQALRRTQATLATEAGATALMVADHLGQTSPAIAERAYIEPSAVSDARNERAFQVIQGGRR